MNQMNKLAHKKLLQRLLSKHFHVSMPIDGVIGPKTINLINKLHVLPDEPDASITRKAIAALQYFCVQYDIDPGPIDGYWGPSTDYAVKQLNFYLRTGKRMSNNWRTDEVNVSLPKGTNKWPYQSQRELLRFYGPVGQNQTLLELPYPMKLAWNLRKTVTKISCHQKVADSMYTVLDEVKNVYGMENIRKYKLNLFGGCLNVRKVRGGNYYSTHSWGVAIDINPMENTLTMREDEASFARPEYDEWWEIWESEQWVSLGRKRNYDWMHIQAALLA